MNADDLAKTFDEVAPQLQRAVDKDEMGVSMLDSYRIHVLNGDMQLWAGPGYAAVTEVLNYDLKRSVMVHLAAGNLDSLMGDDGALMEFARIVKADMVEFIGRRGWEKVLKDNGWRTVAIRMVREV